MYQLILVTATTILLFPYSCQQDEDIPHNEVKNWALKFGVDLWEFGRQFTKMNEISKKYYEHEADVVRKDGLIMIRDMALEVKNLLDNKINAIMRIMDSAEQAALSSKRDNEHTYSYVAMNHQPHLMSNGNKAKYSVNASYSSIIFPDNVKKSESEVNRAVKWSEKLDPVFHNNYEVDPTLQWQYLGSSCGFVRRYPASNVPVNVDLSTQHFSGGKYSDFRTSNWYVGASTSSKDVVILLDTTKSMKKVLSLAKKTVATLISTLGYDDFFNVYAVSDTTKELLPCFKDQLVQAYDIHKQDYIVALDEVGITDGANYTAAISTGFELLQKYNRSGQGCQCNQILIVITAGSIGEHRRLFKEYNWPHMPVRVFTYLIGEDTSGYPELHWIACSNKGYYDQITSEEEIHDKVLNYLRVLARPLVMYQNDHPIHWTPAYIGSGVRPTFMNDEDGHLMTTVSTPIFDRRNTTERRANLLGVVATDVPIREIRKAVPDYKLGVGGYSFMINHNGHALFHPDLRPAKLDTYGLTYSSVDLSNLETMDDDPIDNATIINDLRLDMIKQREGESEIKVKKQYEDMRRVYIKKNKYFYHPIEGTPFSLAIVFPDGHGLYDVIAEKEIKLSQINATEYFKGTNWRVHPGWVYCEYNFPSYYKFNTPEEQILHFLGRTRRPGWKWMSLRPRSPDRLLSPAYNEIKKMEYDSYYCDKSLMQSLVFDAMVTDGLDQSVTSNLKEDKQQGYKRFGMTHSFIGTRSGLFRWRNHSPQTVNNDREFAEANRLAIDEIWYKRAVDQHAIEQDSFVFSVPFDSGANPNSLVTASHAIFIEQKGHKAPVAVVGLQFQHNTLAAHFINITSACTANMGCKKTCASEELDCYVLDDNGFIMLSENPAHTGQFFGQADGTIMDSLVQDGIFRKIPVLDYQGVCDDRKSNPNSANKIMHLSWRPITWLLQWLFARIMWVITQVHLFTLFVPTCSSPQEDVEVPIYSDYEGSSIEYGEPERSGASISSSTIPTPEEVTTPHLNPTIPHVTQAQPKIPIAGSSYSRLCIKKVDLFMLQPNRLNNSGLFNPLKGKLTNCHITGCERPFSVQKIPHSNLILLVVDTLCPCGTKQLSVISKEIDKEAGTYPSCKADQLWRRRPNKCISYHPEESEIKLCGTGSISSLSTISIIISFFTIFLT